MRDKRHDSGEYYPGGRVIARPGTAPQQVVVQWSDVQGKPQIPPVMTLDAEPKEGSQNAARSGGIWSWVIRFVTGKLVEKRDLTDRSWGASALRIKPECLPITNGQGAINTYDWSAHSIEASTETPGKFELLDANGVAAAVINPDGTVFGGDHIVFNGTNLSRGLSVAVFATDTLALTSEVPAPVELDDSVTKQSANPVKSSGIWSAIWGAISAPAASVYEWMVKQLSQKVDKENGKALSTNDYTNEDKNKLNGIEAGAQKNPDLTPYAKMTDVGVLRQLVNENAQSIANKAEKHELSYGFVEKVGDSIVLDDRAYNYVYATTLSDLSITFPPPAADKGRDFIMVLECSENAPTISYESFITLEGEDGVDLTPEEGINVYFFTEVMPWRFAVARKLITKLVENAPATVNQLLRAMADRGLDSDAGNFSDVMTTLGLTDTDTITTAVNAVMKG